MPWCGHVQPLSERWLTPRMKFIAGWCLQWVAYALPVVQSHGAWYSCVVFSWWPETKSCWHIRQLIVALPACLSLQLLRQFLKHMDRPGGLWIEMSNMGHTPLVLGVRAASKRMAIELNNIATWMWGGPLIRVLAQRRWRPMISGAYFKPSAFSDRHLS